MGDIKAGFVQVIRGPGGSMLTRTAGPPLTLLSVDLVRKYGALADAVTRLGEADELVRGINGCVYWGAGDFALATNHYRDCFAAVLAARAALDTGEADHG